MCDRCHEFNGLTSSQRVTTRHKLARGLGAGDFTASQRVTNSHWASTPATFLRHSESQTRTGPRRQRLFSVTTRHKVARGPSASDFSASQRITNSLGAGAPAKSNRHSASQTRRGPKRQCIPTVTARHKLARGLGASDCQPSQRVTNSHQTSAAATFQRHSASQTSTGL